MHEKYGSHSDAWASENPDGELGLKTNSDRPIAVTAEKERVLDSI
jgi:hypothetical protein